VKVRVGEFYIVYEYWFAAAQLTLAMFGMGATLTTDDFKDVLRQPKSVIAGSAMQLLLVPFIAYLFITTLGLTGGIAVGIALIAAIPGGTTSNIFTYMAHGNSPLSISITALTTLACLFTTPLILSLLITDFLPAGFTMPVKKIVIEIALTLLLPLTIGMTTLRYAPNAAKLIAKWSIRASLIAILFIVVGSSAAGRLDMEAFGINNLMIVVTFLGLLAITTCFAPRLLGLNKTDSIAIEMEVIVRNVNLGVLITASMFPVMAGNTNALGDTVLFTVLLYGGLQLLIATGLILTYRRHKRA